MDFDGDGLVGGSLESVQDGNALEEALGHAPYDIDPNGMSSVVDPKLRAWRALANVTRGELPLVDEGDPAWNGWKDDQRDAFEDAVEAVPETEKWADRFGNLPLYASYWWDARVGVYHVRHRVLDPESGRWLQRDPIGYAGGSNLYGYVGDVPHFGVDPMGLDAWLLGDVARYVGLDGLGEHLDDAVDGLFVLDLIELKFDNWGDRVDQNAQRNNTDRGGWGFDDYVDNANIDHQSKSKDVVETARATGQVLEQSMRAAFPAGDAADAIAEAYQSIQDNPSPENISRAGLLVVILLAPGPDGGAGVTRRHSDDRQALLELVKEAHNGDKVLTREQAEILLDWAKEAKANSRASSEDLSTVDNHWRPHGKPTPHIHIDKYHLAVEPGVKPRECTKGTP